MTIVVNKKLTNKEKERLLKKVVSKPKLFDAKKFSGKLKWNGDPLLLQKEWRNE